MTYRGTTINDALDVTPISQTTWRVSDPREDGSSRGILGYIHETADGFEMLWMRPRAGVTRRYGDFAEAVHATARQLQTLRRG